MGILDDLAMGFGLKERTEDYDARTARAIALDDRYGDDHIAQMRARQGYETTSYDPRATPIGKNDQGRMVYRYGYDTSTGPAAQYLGSRNYDEGYTPSMGGTDPSPTPYAIGPLTMDQPLPQFSLLGLFTKGLSSMFQGGDDSGEMGPPRTTVRPILRPDGFTPPTFPTNNGQPETRFDTRTEEEPIDFSDGIPVTDPALIPAIEALALEEGTIPLDPAIPPSSLNAVDPLRLSDMGVDKYGRRVPNKLPKDPKYITGIDMEFPELSAPPLDGMQDSYPSFESYLEAVRMDEDIVGPRTMEQHWKRYKDLLKIWPDRYRIINSPLPKLPSM